MKPGEDECNNKNANRVVVEKQHASDQRNDEFGSNDGTVVECEVDRRG